MTGIERLRDIAYDGPYNGGMVHISVQKLREICEQIEGEAGVETVKADAMEALAFVEEHGGLDEIKERLMPEGMEWPRFEDDEMVGFGDEYVNAKGNVSTLRTIVIKDCRDRLGGGWYWKLGKGACAVVVKNGERIKRTPVLAADGEPLEVGQTVYGTRDLEPVEIVSLRSKEYDVVRTVKCKDRTGFVFYAPGDLTHQRPVLDADGAPIKVGDEVWIAENGHGPRIVKEMYGPSCVHLLGISAAYRADQLTHTKPEPPDSWERIEEDADKSTCEYFEQSHGCGGCPHYPSECNNDKAQDLVRRCKALAERGE